MSFPSPPTHPLPSLSLPFLPLPRQIDEVFICFGCSVFTVMCTTGLHLRRRPTVSACVTLSSVYVEGGESLLFFSHAPKKWRVRYPPLQKVGVTRTPKKLRLSFKRWQNYIFPSLKCFHLLRKRNPISAGFKSSHFLMSKKFKCRLSRLTTVLCLTLWHSLIISLSQGILGVLARNPYKEKKLTVHNLQFETDHAIFSANVWALLKMHFRRNEHPDPLSTFLNTPLGVEVFLCLCTSRKV